jgi:acyl-coenzyme A synthetase/AMP-(fatty) acid ligase
VTLVNTVPSAMTRLVEEGPLPPSVRTVNLAGEPLRRDLVRAIHQAAGRRPVRVVNLYGPSEDTTYSTIAECPADEGREPTIGRPVTGGRAYVVDRNLRRLPVGVPGELVLGGAGVARGYLGRRGLTAERFVPDAFSGREGARLYRTGDRVRFLADGRLEFLGRFDHQVKVRGFRIELGEIEVALRRLPSVADAVVVARGEGAEASLDAYLVPDASPEAAGPRSVGELRDALATTLPGYMIPSTFTFLEALPLTPNGKVDRKALPDPSTCRP